MHSKPDFCICSRVSSLCMMSGAMFSTHRCAQPRCRISTSRAVVSQMTLSSSTVMAEQGAGAQLPPRASVSVVSGVFIDSWCRPRSLSSAAAQLVRSCQSLVVPPMKREKLFHRWADWFLDPSAMSQRFGHVGPLLAVVALQCDHDVASLVPPITQAHFQSLGSCAVEILQVIAACAYAIDAQLPRVPAINHAHFGHYHRATR